MEVEAQEIALYYHAQDEEDDEAPAYLAVGYALRCFTAQEAGEGKRHGGAAHKEEKRHDEVPEPETLPYLVVEMIEQGRGKGGVNAREQTPEDRLKKDKEKEDEAAERIERG